MKLAASPLALIKRGVVPGEVERRNHDQNECDERQEGAGEAANRFRGAGIYARQIHLIRIILCACIQIKHSLSASFAELRL